MCGILGLIVTKSSNHFSKIDKNNRGTLSFV